MSMLLVPLLIHWIIDENYLESSFINYYVGFDTQEKHNIVKVTCLNVRAKYIASTRSQTPQ